MKRWLEGNRQVSELDAAVTGNSRSTIEEAARAQLAEVGYRPLNKIACCFHEGTLTLYGEVSSYYHKQIAQEAIRKLNSVETIVNKIEVWP
jgi:osmotically-inducible protein OsmY